MCRGGALNFKIWASCRSPTSGDPVLICIIGTHWKSTGKPLEDHWRHTGTLDCHWKTTGSGWGVTRYLSGFIQGHIADQSCDKLMWTIHTLVFDELASWLWLAVTQIHWANMGSNWVLSSPDGPQVCSMYLAIWVYIHIDIVGKMWLWTMYVTYNTSNMIWSNRPEIIIFQDILKLTMFYDLVMLLADMVCMCL